MCQTMVPAGAWHGKGCLGDAFLMDMMNGLTNFMSYPYCGELKVLFIDLSEK